MLYNCDDKYITRPAGICQEVERKFFEFFVKIARLLDFGGGRRYTEMVGEAQRANKDAQRSTRIVIIHPIFRAFPPANFAIL